MYNTQWVASPLVVTGFNGHVIALDPKTGAVVWQTTLGGRTYNVRLDVSDQLVVVLGWNELVVLEYATGRIVFRVPVPPNQPSASTMLVDGGLVYLSFLGALTCVSLGEQRVLWHNELPGTRNGPAAIGVPGRSVQADLDRS